MNWVAVDRLLKSEWVRKRATSDLLLVMLCVFAAHYVFNVQPKSQQLNRDAWQQSKKQSEDTLTAALDKAEVLHGSQIDRVSRSFDKAAETFEKSHKEAMDFAKEMFNRVRAGLPDQSDANIVSGNCPDEDSEL